MWEESPIGVWTLQVINDGVSMVQLEEWSLSFLGTETHPQPQGGNSTHAQYRPATKKVDSTTVQPKADPKPHEPVQNAATVGQVLNLVKPERKQQGIDHCLEYNASWCVKCESHYVLFNGRCEESCPVDGYFVGKTNYQPTCIQCYYSCKSCRGPNDYEVSL